MSMTREEREFMQQVSDESKSDRRAAISAAGPFLDAVRRAQLERTLTQECLLSPTVATKVIDQITTGADDDESNPEEVIRGALDPHIKNKRFIGHISGEMAKVVQAGLQDRDQRIVAAGGPARPGPGWTLNF